VSERARTDDEPPGRNRPDPTRPRSTAHRDGMHRRRRQQGHRAAAGKRMPGAGARGSRSGAPGGPPPPPPPPGGAAAAGRSRPRPAANSPQAAHTAPSPGSRKGDGLWPCGDYTVRSTRSTLPACTHVVHVRRYGPIHAYGWIQ
jgi:hypothetical protein